MQNKVKYSELLRRAQSAHQFIDVIGLSSLAKSGRYQRYVKLVSDLDLALKSNQLDAHFEKYGFDKSGFALKELYELTSIIEHVGALFVRSDDEVKKQITSRVKFVLGGPMFTANETHENSRARNYQFELLMATRLLNRGYMDVRFNENPDLTVKIDNRNYAIECKRIIGDFDDLSRKRVSDAITQLHDHRNGYYGGVIALDLSQKYEQGKNWLDGKTREGVEKYALDSLQQDLGSIYGRYPKLKLAASSGLVLGVFASYSGVYVLKETEMGWMHEISAMAMSEAGERMKRWLIDFRNLSHD